MTESTSSPALPERAPGDESESSSPDGEDGGSSVFLTPDKKTAVYTDVEVAKKEDGWVKWLRLLVIFVLLLVAVVVCVVVYQEGRQSETAAFEQAFSDLGEKLVLSFEAVVKQRFGTIASFADTITSDAVGTSTNGSSTFPFVTPPNFIYRVSNTVELAKLMFLFFMPQVPKNQVDAWGDYSTNNTHWITQGLAAAHQSSQEDELSIPKEAPEIFPTIMNVHNPNGPTPAVNVTPTHSMFYPVWTHWPIGTAPFNADINGDAEHQGYINRTVSTGTPTFERGNDYIETELDSRHGMLMKNPFFDYQNDTFSVVFVPVFDSFQNERKAAGILLCIVYWRTYFNQLLPPGADGIYVILENTCDQQYTYRVDGTDAVFLSHGDKHDPKYDYLESGTTLDSILMEGEGDSTEQANSNENCRYSISVYPSQQFEDDHRSNKPWLYVVVLAALFCFVTVVYLLYDYMVQRRQAIVLQSAQQSGTLVNTLFPEDVRNELYKHQQEEALLQKKQDTWQNPEQALTNTSSSIMGRQDSLDNNANASKKPIANLYPDASVYFADLSGFTKWSSQRTPVEVFSLLETLYSAFDDIAQKRGVYKIETIGDCYVAATGLPQPQADHAGIMCRFATECMVKMNFLTASLADSLGEDTAGLAMRVGIHSGPVTAGVLRGQKSRFQLFGDTVNTAARMESNGVPNRIHVSQETADALRARSKGHWLTPREDKIVAKGKGELQTYFVNTGTGSRSKSVVSALTSRNDSGASIDDDDDDDDDIQGSGASNIESLTQVYL